MYEDNVIVQKASKIARRLHAPQTRKWSDEPYFVHPKRVAMRVASLAGTTEVDVAAAVLHDTLEDCAIPDGLYNEYSELIRLACGDEVLALVQELTSPSAWPEWDGKPRAEKRAVDYPHYEAISNRAKRIKLCDIDDNVNDMSDNTPKKYLAKYLAECRVKVGICSVADPELAAQVLKSIENAERNL